MQASGADHKDPASSSSPDLGTFLARLQAVLDNKVLTVAFFQLMPSHMQDAATIQAVASKSQHLQKLLELTLSQKERMNPDLQDALFGAGTSGR